MSILQMQRRELIAGLGATTAWPLVAQAQQAGKIYRIGYFWLGAQPPDPQKTPPWPTLRELGYVEGANLVVERRFAAGRRDRLAAFASELVSLKPDVILAHGGQAAEVSTAEAARAADLAPPEVLELNRRQFGIADGVLDRTVP